MSKHLTEVYTEDGELLGSEYVDLSTLQTTTAKAILHMIYLDLEVDELNDEINHMNSFIEST